MRIHHLNLIAITFVLIFTLNNNSALTSRDNQDNWEINKQAFNSNFELTLQFKTEKGLFSILMKNTPGEEDLSYLRPVNFESMESFWVSQHNILLEDVKLFVEIGTQQNGSNTGATGILKAVTPSVFKSSPVLPTEYQNENFFYEQKYSFPESVLTVLWLYEIKNVNRNTSDLRSFSSIDQFCTYLQNCFAEKIDEINKEKKLKKFKSIRGSLYI